MSKKELGNCVYFHINPIKQEVFYVGIGNLKRPYFKYGRGKLWNNIVNKYDYDVAIIHKNLSWKEACELEVKYIVQIGRRDKDLGSLVNGTAGGDGAHGVIPTQETIEKRRQKMLGHFTSEKTRILIGNANRGRKLPRKSVETRLKSSLALKDKPWTEKRKAAQKSQKGRFQGNKTSQFGTCWITKDNINKKIKKEELEIFISLGWTAGRIYYKKKEDNSTEESKSEYMRDPFKVNNSLDEPSSENNSHI